MLGDMMGLLDKFVNIFKKRIYGKTFYCPVCHLELSYHDTDQNGNLVCPLCGVLIELHEAYGHPLPIVNDVELYRPQPKKRMHPMATHLPIGLFPIALLGAAVLLLVSFYLRWTGIPLQNCGFCANTSPVIYDVTVILLAIAVISSALTFLTGFLDWRSRYGGRPYRIITLKIVLSGLFLLLGVIVIALHFVVFSGGLIGLDSAGNVLATIVYFIMFGAAMFMLATLGHVGGYLVYGK